MPRRRSPLRASTVVETRHLPGDIQIVSFVRELNVKWVKQLTWTSVILCWTHRDPDWLDQVSEDQNERGFFKWVRGNDAHFLAWAARSMFVEELSLLGEGVYEKQGATAMIQWLCVRVTPYEPIAGLTEFSVAGVYLGRSEHIWDSMHFQDLAVSLVTCSVRVVMMQSNSDIRGFGALLVEKILGLNVKAEHIGEGLGGNTQMLLLGESSGFEGELMLPTAVAVPKPKTRGLWKQTVLGAPMSLQDTLDMTLPPIRVKHAILPQSIFCSVWMRGDEKRSNAARLQRTQNAASRRQRQAGKKSRSGAHLAAAERRDPDSSAAASSSGCVAPWRTEAARAASSSAVAETPAVEEGVFPDFVEPTELIEDVDI